MTKEQSQHDSFTQRFLHILEQNQFRAIRSSIPKAAYQSPTSYFGHTPDITAHDQKDRFYIIEIGLTGQHSDEEFEARCKAFAKHSKLHGAKFWIMVPKGKEDTITQLTEKWDIQSNVHLIRGLAH